jgi:hypothetical protein
MGGDTHKKSSGFLLSRSPRFIYFAASWNGCFFELLFFQNPQNKTVPSLFFLFLPAPERCIRRNWEKKKNDGRINHSFDGSLVRFQIGNGRKNWNPRNNPPDFYCLLSPVNCVRRDCIPITKGQESPLFPAL